MRDSNRRGCVLAFTVMIHGLIIYDLATAVVETRPASQLAIQIEIIQKPLRAIENIQPLAPRLSHIFLSPISFTALAIPLEPLSAPKTAERALASDSMSESLNVAGVVSTAAGTNAGGGGAAESVTARHQVQPIYPSVAVQAKEEGTVVVSVLINERGRVGKVEVVRSSGYRRLDNSVVDALRQWTFAPPGTPSQPRSVTTRIGWGFHLENNALAASITLIPFDSTVERQIQAAAIPGAVTRSPPPYGEQALGRLIARIRTTVRWGGHGPPRSQIQLLAEFGAVRSIRFLGIESHGIEVNDTEAAGRTDRSKWHQWEAYAVEQEGGNSEWLIDVTRFGYIRTAQAMTCVSSCQAKLATRPAEN
jgi:TonB family protein